MADSTFDPNQMFSLADAGFDKGQIAQLTPYFPSGQIRGSDIGNVYGLLNTIAPTAQGGGVSDQQNLAFSMLSQIGRSYAPASASTAVAPAATNPSPTPGQTGGETFGTQGAGTAAGGGSYLMAGTQPETNALAQMAQIDPTSEALRQALGQSFLSTVGGGAPPPQFQGQTSAAAPNASDVQSYLDLYKQIDPQGYQQRVDLAGSESAFVQQMQDQYALGAQLTTGQAREVDQATREAQAARGNVYGTPQLVQEAMTRGQYGIQLEQQRQQNLANALAGQQSYLQSGTGIGDVANALYGQGFNRYAQTYANQMNAWQAQQNALLNQRNQALSYLGSGQTPYEAGASYYDRAQANAQQAASYGAPSYQPSALGQQYTGTGAGSYPQYGLQIGNQATNWYNSMVNQNYGLGQLANQQSAQSSALGGGIGTAAGSLLGGVVGSVFPVVGTAAGAAIGGALGGAAGRSLSA